MKRFLLFSAPHYDQIGGWGDFDGSFDTTAEAEARFRTDIDRANENLRANGVPEIKLGDRWWHIVDTETGEIVKRSEEE